MTLFRYLLTDDGEDEVGVGLREEAPLGSALAEADAREPSGRDAHQRLDVLVAGVLVVGPRVEEREDARPPVGRSEEHTSELQSLMRISYAVFCLKTQKNNTNQKQH